MSFHQSIAHLQRPGFIARSDDPWRQADRMAWEEAAMPPNELLHRLDHEFRSVSSPRQMIHGDLLGNVLFTPDEPPTIIDWSAYWSPSGLGAAIAAVDAACWHEYPTDPTWLHRRVPR